MSTLRNLNVNLELGQTILVGANREPAQITKIEFHEKSGEIDINTTKGPRNGFSPALPCALMIRLTVLLIQLTNTDK